jgi:hypothetical protein
MLRMPDNIFSRSPWNLIYIGQIRDRAGNYRRCWVFFDPRVPIVYHQPEGGFPAEVDSRDLEVVEASIPDIFVHGNRNVVQRASDAARAMWPWLEKSGVRFCAQQNVAASISANTLPKLYRTFDFKQKLGCPKQGKQGENSENTNPEDGCVVSLHQPGHERYHECEQQFFDFKAPYREDHQLAMRTALILQHRFGTNFPPSVDLIYNMKYFGGSYARYDSRKVFEFHEWNAWLSNDRSTQSASK